jgi:dethiobiotin synthase
MISKAGIFITGTDTHVGKTVVSSLIVSALLQAEMPAGYFKPVQTGTDLDCETVRVLGEAGHAQTNLIIENPVYAFPEPISPNRAALKNQCDISIDSIRKRWDELPDRTWVVEGAGGLLVPLNSRQSIRDLIVALEIPMILVASTRLGTINHTLLSLECASRSRIKVLGMILVGDEDLGLADQFRGLADVPVLAEIPTLHQLSASVVSQVAVDKFPLSKLQEWFRNV